METYRIDITSDEQTITGATYDNCITSLSMDLDEDPNQIVDSTGATNGNFTMHCTANAHEQSREYTYRLVYTYDGGSCEHNIHLVQDGKEPLGTKFILQYMDGTPTYTKECDGVNNISQAEFENKDYVSACTVGSCVEQLAREAFERLTNLKKVDMSNSNIDGISEGTFSQCYNLTDVKFSNKTETIDRRAFVNCSGLTSISLPSVLTEISEDAFTQCYGLTSITIPNSVTTIGNYAFGHCSGLTNVIIGSNVTTIGFGAFYWCWSLTSVTIGNSVTSIGANAFASCNILKSVTIPNSVTSIGEDAFDGCRSLTSCTIPNSVTSIGGSAFNNSPWWNSYSADTSHHYGNIVYINDVAYRAVNKSVTSVTLKNGTKGIGGYAFYECRSLTNIDIPDSVTNIGSHALGDCSGLTSITIGKSVTSIGASAFYNCRSLTSLTVKATTPPTLDSTAFVSTNNCPIYVPSASVSAYKSASVWSNYADRIQAIS